MKGMTKLIAILAFILWVIVLWKASSIFGLRETPLRSGEEDGGIAASQEANPLQEAFLSIKKLLESPFPYSKYQPLIEKNIFVKPEPPPEVFTPDKLEIIAISAVPLPIMYNGFIEKSDGTRIGQINWSGKTYFVKRSDKVKDYRVTEINSKNIKIENKDGQIVLEYKKQAKSRELVAKLRNSMDNKEYEVKKNDEIGGYKILDIKTNAVILYGGNKEWVINNGR